MLKAIRKHAKRKRLHAINGLGPILAIRQHAG